MIAGCTDEKNCCAMHISVDYLYDCILYDCIL